MLFSTKQSYNSYNPDIKHVLTFMHSLYKRNLGYSAINVARSALSTFVIVDNQAVGKHPLVTRYLKGVFNSKPALPKYSFTWDAGKVIKHLSKVDISELKGLTLKLATLLALLCGQRAREILSVMDIPNTVIKDNSCFIRIGDLLKTSGPNFHVGQLEYPAFSEDKSICPVTCLEQYINKTRNHRGAYTKLFLSYIKPFKPVSMDTLSRWIKNTLRDSGIDMNIFSPHSTRSASTTFDKQYVPLETVLKTGGWRPMKTFALYYNKPVITDENNFATNILINVNNKV